MKTTDQEILDLKQELSGTATQLRGLKTGGKDSSDAISQHKASVRRSLDDMERRHEAYGRACAVFSEALHIPNPLMAMASACVT